MRRPKGLLLDYGGTLVVEAGYDPRAGSAAVLAKAALVPPGVTLDAVSARARRINSVVGARRDEFGIETPWPSITRLIYDYLGVRFDEPMRDLELAFWKASVTTWPQPGAREALAELARRGVQLGVLSNSSFAPGVIRYELDRHGLADHLAFVMVSADYVVRKPSPFLFETAAVRLGVRPDDIWFVGDRLDTDIAGAKAAGIPTVWMRPAGHADSVEPDLVVDGWAGLLSRFRESA